ncbi:MAG: hypothetical protein ACJ0F8_02775 [Gammaproteobacteria bacterium]|uniref:Transcription regulator TrmB N-terminal domain-containing protein n=1 Tax=SAR86 cluster bacterium TaxID=2030880 RepID=A0A520N0B0_9GAMM|nr:hypothetical protein [Gammaproteobacteria bacterium]MBA4729617.1 hypothetical protein [SAR86 cluster bacterium]RZO26914.1 MAG: hypothetical protein EVA92_01840 [SAR86 cluster bacterium]|tara:strand:+ start:773 stop:1060 length:288 start_codon:yes stop_codon:yes gene_type:complete
MSKVTNKIIKLRKNLVDLMQELSINDLNETEISIFFNIVHRIEKSGYCSMLQAVEVSKKSRSTVYKTIRKLVQKNIFSISTSKSDRRSFLVNIKI